MTEFLHDCMGRRSLPALNGSTALSWGPTGAAALIFRVQSGQPPTAQTNGPKPSRAPAIRSATSSAIRTPE